MLLKQDLSDCRAWGCEQSEAAGMLRTLSRRVTQLQSAAARRCSDQAAKTPAAVKPSEAAEVTAHEAAPRIHTYTPNNVDRKILVHFKYYPSLAEVPDKVDQGTMSRVRRTDRR